MKREGERESKLFRKGVLVRYFDDFNFYQCALSSSFAIYMHFRIELPYAYKAMLQTVYKYR